MDELLMTKGTKVHEDWMAVAAWRDAPASTIAVGIDRSYSEYVKESVERLMERVSDELIYKYSSGNAIIKKQRAGQVRRVVMKMVERLSDEASETRYHMFVKPVLDAIGILPKEELAELAGSLVSLTSLKRRISMDAETVGGPIDVAVISKGDGFIWIRRKHYFNPELNPHFISKYLREYLDNDRDRSN